MARVDYQVNVGSDLIMACPIDAYPLAQFAWFHGDVQIDTSGEVVSLDEMTGTLTISNITLVDEGHYACNAFNQHGILITTIEVTVTILSKIVSRQSEVTVETGSRAYLPCKAIGRPKPVIEWSVKGKAIVTQENERNGRFSMLADGTLSISDARLEDDHYYTCVASNSANRDQARIGLRVTMRPIIKKRWDVMPVEGANVTLECEAEGVPEPEVSWYLDDGPIYTSDRFDVDTNRIVIYEVEGSDSGEWKCIAENEVGSAEESEQVQVQTIPDILQKKQVEKLTEHETLSLYCRLANQNQPTTITWLVDGELIEGEIEAERLHFSPDRSVLTITKLKYVESGKYSCVAENVAGMDEITYDVIVQQPPSISGPKEELSETSVMQELTLRCPYMGDPMPRITWFHRDQPISYDYSRKYTIGESGATLTIEHTGEEDQGQWFCIADSPIGKDMKTFSIDIIKPPRITTHQPDDEQKTTVLEGAPLQLYCEVEGSPMPDIVWSFNGMALNDATFNITKHGQVLTLPNSAYTNTGVYSCNAHNKAGDDSISYVVEIQIEPKITLQHELVEVEEGQVARLLCSADGIPVPEITWYKDNQLISLPDPDFESDDDGLIIRRAISAYSGIYKCVAHSDLGADEGTTRIEVLIRPKMSSTKTSLTVVVHDSVELTCDVDSNPAAEIAWQHKGQLVGQTSRLRAHQDLVNSRSRLRIRDINLGDQGVWSCVANNTLGTSQLNFQIDVNVPPKIIRKRFYFSFFSIAALCIF